MAVPPAAERSERLREEAEGPSAYSGRASRARVDLDVLTENVGHIRSSLAPGVDLMAVVKANGYGHGAVMTARTVVEAGASQLAVATTDEGVVLRRAGLRVPILVLGPTQAAEVDAALRHRLSLMLGDAELVRTIAGSARRLKLDQPVNVHIKIDTGMRRYGALPEEAAILARQVVDVPELRLTGIATHFASADDDERFTREQAEILRRCVGRLREAGIEPPLVHAANSAAALRSPQYGFDLARVGIALYGLPPSPSIPLPPGVGPVMTLRSRVARLISLQPGDTVGYGRTYRADKREQAALVPIGYADGYRRGFSSRAWMGLHGHRAPVLGRVCMDQTVVAVPAGRRVAVGDEIVIAGQPETGAPTFSELADLIDSIPYEIATGIAARVPRHYWRGGRLVAVEDLQGLHELNDH